MALPLPDPSPEQIRNALEELDVVEVEREIFTMGRTMLKRLFDFRTSGNLDVSRLAASIIWQDLGLLRQGHLEPFDGNIRSYWYSRLKPTMDRAGANSDEMGNGYGAMITAFSRFVGVYRLFAYRQFGFRDGRAHMRHIGQNNPHIVVVGEKEGHLVLLAQIAERFGCSTIALKGSPSILATEYFALALDEAGLGQSDLQVLTFVDFDPAGDEIVEAFLEQMRDTGFGGRMRRQDIAVPERLTLEQLRLNKFALSRKAKQRTKKENWLERTGGGIGRVEPDWRNFGFECDAMTSQQVFAAITDLTDSNLSTSVEDIERDRLERQLAHVLEQLLMQRLLGPRL
jgi:hypothetical protein